jgi:Domain of unknown function (DUF4406)
VKVYLAGPMKGIPEFGFPAFREAAEWLRGEHYIEEVFSPAEYDLERGFDPLKSEEEQGFNLRETLLEDLTWIIRNADAVILLPGWGDSKGVRAEARTADAIGIPVYEYEEMRRGFMDEVF